MGQYSIKTFGAIVSLLLIWMAGPVRAASLNINFTGLTSSSQDTDFNTLTSNSVLLGSGVNTINDPELSITALNFTHTGSLQDALFAVPSSSAMVAWDYNLNQDGSLRGNNGNVECGKSNFIPTCGGLGVVGGVANNNTDAINGNAGGLDQALIFSFGNGLVPADSISIDFRGFDSGDTVEIYVEFRPSNGSPSDVAVSAPAAVNGGTQTISLSALAAALNTTTPVSKIGIYVENGDIGIGRLQYTQTSAVVTPEPSTYGFLCVGILFGGCWHLRRTRLASEHRS